jgi:hypothetical protein
MSVLISSGIRLYLGEQRRVHTYVTDALHGLCRFMSDSAWLDFIQRCG